MFKFVISKFSAVKRANKFLFALSQRIDTSPAFQNSGQHKKCEFEKEVNFVDLQKGCSNLFVGNTVQLSFAEAQFTGVI